MKKWEIISKFLPKADQPMAGKVENIVAVLLKPGTQREKGHRFFLNPPDPSTLTPKDVGIDKISLMKAIRRIKNYHGQRIHCRLRRL